LKVLDLGKATRITLDRITTMEFFVGILAGGQSARFGSNKCLYRMGGKALIAIILSQVPLLRLEPRCVFISLYNEDQVAELINHLPPGMIKSDGSEPLLTLDAKGNHARKHIPVKFVFDDQKRNVLNTRASILGIHSLLEEVPAGYVQVIPCDTPFFTADIMNVIHASLQALDGHVDALVPRWKNGFIEPLHAVYNRETMIEKVAENINKRIFKLSELFNERVTLRYFSIEEKLEKVDPGFKAFNNLNSRDIITDP